MTDYSANKTNALNQEQTVEDVLNDWAIQINELGRSSEVDIRLEVLLAELMQGQLSLISRLLMYSQGGFARNYRPDVGISLDNESKEGAWVGYHYALDNPKKTEHQVLNLPVFRDSLYDYLPEGLFHQPVLKRKSLLDKSQSEEDLKIGLEEIKIQHERQQAARRLFMPIEQAFYWIRLVLELEERNYLLTKENLSQRFEHAKLLRNIWGLPTEQFIEKYDIKNKTWLLEPLLEPHQLSNLLYLLPIAHRLVPDQKLVRDVFELILGIDVQFKTIHPQKLRIDKWIDGLESAPTLGQVVLGDFVLGGLLQDTMLALEIQIGPIKPEQLQSFRQNGQRKGHNQLILDLLINYFLPAETETIIKLITNPADYLLSLSINDNVSYLGYTYMPENHRGIS